MRFRPRQELAAIAGGLPAVYWWLWTGMLVNRFATFVVGFLGLYLTERRGMPIDRAGLVVALWGLGSVGAGPVAGILCDRIGRRATLLTSLVLGSFCTMALGFVSSPAALAALTLAVGFVGEMYRPAVQAAIADVVRPEDRAQAFSLLYWAVNLGFSFGFSIGGFLASVSWAAVFVADGLTTLAFAALVYARIPETKPAHLEKETVRRTLSGAVAPLRDPVFATFLALNFLVVLVFFQFQLALPFDIRSRGLPAAAYGALLTLNGIIIVLVQPFVARFLRRLDSSQVMAAAAVLVGAGFGLNGLCRSLPAYAVAVVVWTMGEIANHPVASGLASELAPATLRGRYQGAFSLSWAVPAMVAPALGGAVVSRYGTGALWAGCFGLGLLAAAGQLGAGASRRQRLATARAANGAALGSVA